MSERQAPGAPAGWYPDPEMAGTQRYWTGSEWSEHIAPAATHAPPGVAQAEQPEVADGVALAGSVIGLLFPIAGVIIALTQTGKKGTLPIWLLSAVGFLVWYAVLSN